MCRWEDETFIQRIVRQRRVSRPAEVGLPKKKNRCQATTTEVCQARIGGVH